MDIALTILALIQGGALVYFYMRYDALEQSNHKILIQTAAALDAVKHLTLGIDKSEPNERLKLLEQKVAVLQMKR